MVAKDGFEMGMFDAARKDFSASATALGWEIELIPSERIPDFKDFIDDLRR